MSRTQSWSESPHRTRRKPESGRRRQPLVQERRGYEALNTLIFNKLRNRISRLQTKPWSTKLRLRLRFTSKRQVGELPSKWWWTC